MTLSQILVLAVIQGAAELLPISSSAHVIVAEKLMGLDPTAPEMTLLLEIGRASCRERVSSPV